MKDTSFLTAEQVIDYLQVDVRTVYRLIKDGRLPAVRVGRQWRFRKHDIDAWLAGQPSSVSQAEPSPKVLVVDDEPGVAPLVGAPEGPTIALQFVGLEAFTVLGVDPLLGRTFISDEALVGFFTESIIISHDFWQQHFNGNPR